MVLLVRGQMQSRLEEEAGTFEDVSVGHFIGELALILGQEGRRLTTVHTVSDCVVYELDEKAWVDMKQKQPGLAIHVMSFACRYLQHRVQHVSNRFVETRCIPI